MRFDGALGLVSATAVALLALPLQGCSSSKGGGPKDAAASGGQPGSGGTGSGGSSAKGGASGAGGLASSGGATGSGGSGSGGASGKGGASAAGGSGGTDAAAAGGSAAQGGVTGAGGVALDASMGAGGTAAGGKLDGGGAGAGGGTCQAPAVTLSGTDAVAGTLITFNDNGGWCWYQDERAVVDKAGGKLLIGSVASASNDKTYPDCLATDTSRNGKIEAVLYDLAAKGTPKRFTLSTSTDLDSHVDDHNAPAFVIRPDGGYLAMWSGHRVDCFTRFSSYSGSTWAAEKKFDWTPEGCPWPGADTNEITYSNPWYLGSSVYAFVRSVATDPAALTSTDNGQSWSYVGRLASSPQVGYVAGYFKYWGNNSDRIDFVGTEAHPRNADTSLYHGYVQGGKVYDSKGTAIDSSLKDPSASTTNAQDITQYTTLFKTRTSVNGVSLSHAWDIDLVRYDDGTLAVIGQGRASWTGSDTNSSGLHPDVRLIYARYDGTQWRVVYLGKAGPQLYSDEEDYVGLGALHPDDPHTIYISTSIDPRDDTTDLGKREIFQGTMCDLDKDTKFTWTPVTQKSSKDNIRPIVPKWDASHTALLWLRGEYCSAQSYKLAIVGLISGS